MPESNERSAEWLRGAVESHINTCNLITSITSDTKSHPARQGLMAAGNELHNQLDRYRALLAAAETREGGEAIGWVYKLWVDKHMTGAPLPGEEPIPGGNGFGKKSDHIHFSVARPNGLWTWWESPVYAHPPAQPTAAQVQKQNNLRLLAEWKQAEERLATAAEVIEVCRVALEKSSGYVSAFENLHKCAWGDAGMCKSAKDDLTETEDAMRDALALCARWKEANGDSSNTR